MIEPGIERWRSETAEERDAVAGRVGRVIEPGTKCSLHRRKRHNNNRIDNVELLKLHRGERYDNSGINRV